MRKQMSLLTLLVSVAILAVPGVAAAGSPQVDPGAGLQWAGTGTSLTLSSSGEQTLTCEQIDVQGEFYGPSSGAMAADLTGCHTVFFGLTTKCHTLGSPLDNTIQMQENVFDTTYLTDGKGKPGLIITPPFPTVICGSTNFQIEGIGVLATLVGWECGKTVLGATLSYKAAGSVQEHQTVTATGPAEWSLEERTKGKLPVKAVLSVQIPISFSKSATLTCA